MMLFGEKYGDDGARARHRLSRKELCGGTHVQRTGDIGLFKIVAEGGVAAGIRRVEAVTGDNALAYLQQLEARSAAWPARSRPAGRAAGARRQVLEQVRALEKELAALKGKLASARATSCWPRRSTSRASRCWPRARRRRRQDAARDHGQAQGQAQDRRDRAGRGGRRQGAA
jgi:alanyl-tRNA synthetase